MAVWISLVWVEEDPLEREAKDNGYGTSVSIRNKEH
jgi:hypothetical protein